MWSAERRRPRGEERRSVKEREGARVRMRAQSPVEGAVAIAMVDRTNVRRRVEWSRVEATEMRVASTADESTRTLTGTGTML